MRTLIIALTALASLSMAHADVNKSLPYQCGMRFSTEGGGLQALVGYWALKGYGEINCVDLAGNVETIPVKVKMGGKALAANFAIGKLEMVGLASGIGIASGPEELLGKYFAVGGRAAIGGGVGADIALAAKKTALVLNVSVQFVKGFGAQLGVTQVKIERADHQDKNPVTEDAEFISEL